MSALRHFNTVWKELASTLLYSLHLITIYEFLYHTNAFQVFCLVFQYKSILGNIYLRSNTT